MNKLLATFTTGLHVLIASTALAAEKSVTLAVENMTCAACPLIVKGSLAAVPGVRDVVVSLENKTATVTFDDTQAAVPILISATTNAGYPSVEKN